MDEKEKIQDEELHQVAGGHGSNTTMCYKCDKWFEPKESNGTYVRIKHSCFDYECYYVCPYCGYKRKVT